MLMKKSAFKNILFFYTALTTTFNFLLFSILTR